MFRRVVEGWVLQVHLTPNAAKDEISEIFIVGDTRVLKVRVRAIADKGKANKALCEVLAKYFGLPKSSLEVISGHKSRTKGVLIRAPEFNLEQELKRLDSKQ